MARYINHSCRPNAEPVVGKGRIVFKALCAIEPGEEITYNYGREYFEYFIDRGGCRCAACLTKGSAVRRSKRTAPRKPK